MSKIRVYQFAKDLGIDTRVVIAKCAELGIPVKSHASGLDEAQTGRIKNSLGMKEEPKRAPAAPTTAGTLTAPSGTKIDEESGVTVHVIKEQGPAAKGTEVRHVKLEKIMRRDRPRPRRGGGGRDDRRTAARRPELPAIPTDKTFEVEAPINVKDLSHTLGVKTNILIGKLMEIGVMTTINQLLDEETLVVLADKLGVKVEIRAPKPMEEEVLVETEDKPEDLALRAPVVTLMGHVDHGKTSILDRIRKSDVVSTEDGGITQHIGAYRVDRGDKHIVFLDTPGHAAFTEMRARGANVTDLVVLVVAADDGLMPQTIEAISHARAAEVPILVAINKCDKPDADVRRVKQQLAEHDLASEDWGGKTTCVELSALTGKGIDDLLEMLTLESEMLELKANPDKPARGIVLESRLSGNRGILVHILVEEGTLKRGDVILCGTATGRIRNMRNDRGKSLREAGPATPVEITGLDEVPEAGDRLYVLGDAKQAKQVAASRRMKVRERDLVRKQHVTLETLASQLGSGEGTKEVRVVLKVDVKGSLEVIEKNLEKLATDEVNLRIIHTAVGAVNESDVLLADASDAVIIGFHVVVEDRARDTAERRGVDIRTYRVIYEITDEMKKALEGMLDPEEKEVVLGKAEVRQVFAISRFGNIAGCHVTRGMIRRNTPIRLARDGIVIHEGRLSALKRFKDDVREVQEGFECGMNIEGYNDVKEGDLIECYEIQKVKRSLDSPRSSAKESKG